MIKEVIGDILLSRADAMAHGVAPHDDFKQGLALALREKWPAMYKDFRHFCKTKNPESGSLWLWQGVGGFKCFNLFTQQAPVRDGDRPGRADLVKVNHCLKELRRAVEAEGIRSLALPRLATGVGGLDWKDVSPLIENHLGDLDFPVYVYTTYQSGVEGEA